MKNNIQKILEDIYMIDPDLKDHEKDLVKVIEKLLENKPEIVIDKNFIDNLRSDLLASDDKVLTMNDETNNKNLNTNIMSKLYYALGGAVTMAAVMFLAFNLGLSKDQKQVSLNVADVSFVPGNINSLSDNAFGIISGNISEEVTLDAAAPQGLGGGAAVSERSLARPESGGGGANKMIAYPDMVVYKYVYEGELNLSDTKKQVYKKIISSDLGKGFSGVISGVNFNMLDLSQFKGSVLKNFRIGQDTDLGYDVFVDLETGSLSINENNKGWYDNVPREMVCDEMKGCKEIGGLQLSDIPEDQVLISMTDQFLRDKKVNMKNYGIPKVDNRWREQYLASENKEYFYIPEVVGVVYPLLIDGQEIKSMDGGDYGLRVNVNLRKNKVAGLYSLAVNNYESSMYETETDAQKILKIVERGGYHGYYFRPENAREEVLKLGDPKLVYVSYMIYKENSYDELFVPSLLFPIIEKPKIGYYYPENVVVPLVKDLIKEDLDRPIEPMPMLRGEKILDDSGGESGIETMIEPEALPMIEKDQILKEEK